MCAFYFCAFSLAESLFMAGIFTGACVPLFTDLLYKTRMVSDEMTLATDI